MTSTKTATTTRRGASRGARRGAGGGARRGARGGGKRRAARMLPLHV